MAQDTPPSGIAGSGAIPAAALPGRRAAGDHTICRGESAVLYLRVAFRRDRSSWYITRLVGKKWVKTDEEAVTDEGWHRVAAVFSQADPVAGARLAGQRERQAVWDGIDGNEVDIMVPSVFLVGGFGLGRFEKTKLHQLRFGDDALLVSLPGVDIQAFPYGEVVAIAVDGETITTGGGFVGGGFGLEGAAEGMAIASVLNAMTTKTTVRTILDLQVSRSHFVFLSTQEAARDLTTRLLPVKAKVRLAAQEAARPPDSGLKGEDQIAQLERLAALHAAGALSDAEFTAAKQRLIFE